MTDLLQAAAEAVELGESVCPGPYKVMRVPPASRVDHGWRAIAKFGFKNDLMLAVPADVAFEHAGPGFSEAHANYFAAAPSHVALIRGLAAEVVRLREAVRGAYSYDNRTRHVYVNWQEGVDLTDCLPAHVVTLLKEWEETKPCILTGDSHER